MHVSRGIPSFGLDNDEIGFGVFRTAVPIQVVKLASPKDFPPSIHPGERNVHFELTVQSQRGALSGSLRVTQSPSFMFRHCKKKNGLGAQMRRRRLRGDQSIAIQDLGWVLSAYLHFLLGS